MPALARRRRFYPLPSIFYPLTCNRTGRAPHQGAGTDSKRIGPPRSPGITPRSAFTIIELLVVVTIIAILMSLVVSVIGAFLTQARDAATKSTLNKVQGLANQRAQAFLRLSMRKGVVTTTDATQKILTMKQAQVRYFPQRIVEINQADQPDLWNIYNLQFALGGNFSNYNPANDPNHTLRSSEILYNFLTQSNVLGDAPITTDAFSAAEVQDTDGNGLPEFIDAWGQPLRFYRWPTRLFRSGGLSAPNTLASITTPLNPLVKNTDGTYDTDNAKLLFSSLPVFSGNLANDLNRDPDDPLRVCLNNGNFTGQQFEFAFHTPCTYHTLLIVSAGPDGQMGIFEPDQAPVVITDIVTPHGNLAQPIPGQQDALTDNIMYLNVRAGGK